jgi:hypothetical protein
MPVFRWPAGRIAVAQFANRCRCTHWLLQILNPKF